MSHTILLYNILYSLRIFLFTYHSAFEFRFTIVCDSSSFCLNTEEGFFVEIFHSCVFILQVRDIWFFPVLPSISKAAVSVIFWSLEHSMWHQQFEGGKVYVAQGLRGLSPWLVGSKQKYHRRTLLWQPGSHTLLATGEIQIKTAIEYCYIHSRMAKIILFKQNELLTHTIIQMKLKRGKDKGREGNVPFQTAPAGTHFSQPDPPPTCSQPLIHSWIQRPWDPVSLQEPTSAHMRLL